MARPTQERCEGADGPDLRKNLSEGGAAMPDPRNRIRMAGRCRKGSCTSNKYDGELPSWPPQEINMKGRPLLPTHKFIENKKGRPLSPTRKLITYGKGRSMLPTFEIKL